MNRPTLEVADIIRSAGARFIERSKSHLAWPLLKAMRAIERCRTAALGGHRDHCLRCGHDFGLSYNSCRNRHCPKCQTHARNQWIAARTRDLVPLGYFHVVFTVPQELSALMLQNKRLLYSLLFRTSAESMLEMAADPAHLGAEIGFMSILHTWGQTLQHHPHVHCVVPEGGFSPDRTRWIRPKYRFFLPVQALSKTFRGKFVEALEDLHHKRKLALHGGLQPLADPPAFARFVQTLHRHKWVVYAKKPFGGPEHVLHYLGRYTHRVAISNHRLLSYADGKVTFRWKDYAHRNKQRKMTLEAHEFVRRFLLHVLPRAFVRIRHFGWLSNRSRTELAARCRALLADEARLPPPPPTAKTAASRQCPLCGGPLTVAETFTARELWHATRSRQSDLDSS